MRIRACWFEGTSLVSIIAQFPREHIYGVIWEVKETGICLASFLPDLAEFLSADVCGWLGSSPSREEWT